MQRQSGQVLTFTYQATSPSLGQSSRWVVTRLNQEWEELGHEPAEWMSPAPCLDEVLTSIRFNPDQVLSNLIDACQRGNPLAGRVIVQALLPKIILQSRTYPYPGAEDLLSALWIRIARYPLTHRPTSVAANLLLDSRKDVISERRCAPILVPETAVIDEELTADRVLATARSLGLATPETLRIIEEVYVEGLDSKRVAERHDMSSDAVRRRCSDTLRRLRSHRNLITEMAAAA